MHGPKNRIREDIAKDFNFIDVGNRKMKHCYINTYCNFAVKCPHYGKAASCRRRDRII
jgi:hypothetical protein